MWKSVENPLQRFPPSSGETEAWVVLHSKPDKGPIRLVGSYSGLNFLKNVFPRRYFHIYNGNFKRKFECVHSLSYLLVYHYF